MAPALPTTGRSSVLVTPNVAPMIDVMLVLLIIFMLVTPSLSGAVHLPEGVNATPRPEDVQDRTLTIDAQGMYTLNGERLTKASLPATLGRYVAAHPLDRVLYLRADKGLDYGVVLDAMDTARGSGIAMIGMVTEVPSSVPGQRARAVNIQR